jgi:hypothetical protein
MEFDLLSGNWGVDLQAGSQFGYHLLFVILVSGILAAFLQVIILIIIDGVSIDFLLLYRFWQVDLVALLVSVSHTFLDILYALDYLDDASNIHGHLGASRQTDWE